MPLMTAEQRHAEKARQAVEMEAHNKAMKDKLKNAKPASDTALTPEQEKARAKAAEASRIAKEKNDAALVRANQHQARVILVRKSHDALRYVCTC